MQTRRHFVRVGDREVHYRQTGSGPPFILFHVSPQNSTFVLPGLLPLAEHHTLIALDTPGYGESDPLPQNSPVMADYADAVIATMDVLGIDRAPLYGSHTGANIAVEVARRTPDRVAALVLDGLSLSTPEVAQDRTARYAPRFEPSAGGEHLAWAWQHTRDQLLFWPWYEPHLANRLDIGMKSPDFIHAVVVAKMAAADYWLGYRAAFNHDSRDALRQLQVDTFFVTALADEHTAVERSIPDLPDNIRFIDTDAAGQLAAIQSILTTLDVADYNTQTKPFTPRRRISRAYVGPAGNQRLVRQAGSGTGKPLLLLHGGMRTSALLNERMTALSATRPVIGIDIAGNGDSDPLAPTQSGIGAYAEDVNNVMDAWGIDAFDVYGESAGGLLALEVARQAGQRVERIILDRPENPNPEMREQLMSRVAPPLEARWDGSHLLTAWHMLRDGALFWPWYERSPEGIRHIEPEIEAATLQRQLLAWMKGRSTYADYVHATLAADTAALLASNRRDTLVLSTRGDRLEPHAAAVAEQIGSAELVLMDQLSPPTSVMAAFLEAKHL